MHAGQRPEALGEHVLGLAELGEDQDLGVGLGGVGEQLLQLLHENPCLRVRVDAFELLDHRVELGMTFPHGSEVADQARGGGILVEGGLHRLFRKLRRCLVAEQSHPSPEQRGEQCSR